MTNFYNSNNEIIDFAYEYPCIFEDIYILNMKNDELLISYDPSFMQNANGIVIGIDSRFKKFYVINKNGTIIKSLKLEWKNDCLEFSSQLQEKSDNLYFSLFVIGIVFIIIVILLNKKRSKNENT